LAEFRFRHPWVFWAVTVLVLVAAVTTPVQYLRMLLLGFRGLTPDSIARYDLRPFPVGGPELQGTLWRAMAWGWWVAGAAALWALVTAWRTPGARAAVCCQAEGMRPGRWLALAGLGVAGAALLTLCGAHCLWTTAPPVGSLHGLTGLTAVRFPQDARLLEGRGEGGWKGTARAVILMPQASARQFLSQPIFDEGPTAQARPDWSRWRGGELRQWQPARASRFLAASGTSWAGSNVVSVAALVDFSAPGDAVVYFEWVRE